MDEKKKNVPKRRFKEFKNADAWEQRELGEICNITMGQSPDSINYTLNPLYHILVQGNADIKNSVIVPRIWTTQITKIALKNDIIFTVRAPVGDVAKNEFNLVIGRGVAAISGNEFIFQFLQHLKQNGYWKKLSSGSTFDSISSLELKSLPIKLPSAEEQKRIGELLVHIDQTITLHQRKLEKYKAIKESYLEEMFPAEGQRKPKRRFTGFADDWEQREFSELVNKLSKTSASNSLPKIEFEDIISGEGRLNKDVSTKFDNRKGILFNENNILYGKLRPYLKNWLYTDFKGIALGDFWVFEANYIEPKFLYFLIQADIYQKTANDTSGTKMPRSDWQKVSSTKFYVPRDLKEQIKIGNLLMGIEETLTLHQKKLDKLKKLKEALLEEMFV
ncbi:restriction endonuclease subunit S [Macrococcoides canis]|uniref:restriction endonuclease subunit S n=1 Tax=Macrococcoides canis TaxID=1855823 RepID=UPI0020B6F7BE|nr:restriction endonuclease subunit S [Macrococcus canis]UTH02098.1 restriction endonuclease subunit S [Macrococcus canis]